MIFVDNKTPTSSLLDVKQGDNIDNGQISGSVKDISIQETDEYLMFLFLLENNQEIVIKKIRQVC